MPLNFRFTGNPHNPKYISATADIIESNSASVNKSATAIKRLPDGNFIFAWQKEHGEDIYLVLTSNDGIPLSNGRVRANDQMENPDIWLDKNSKSHSIDNFQGMNFA